MKSAQAASVSEVNQPKPDVNQPKPEVNQPKPEVNQPKPEVNQPEPEVNQLKLLKPIEEKVNQRRVENTLLQHVLENKQKYLLFAGGILMIMLSLHFGFH